MASPPLPEAPSIPDFELLRQIGRGSYGDVWLARGVTGIYRAIKIVWRARFADAEPFEREFRGLKEFAAISLGEKSQLALLHVGRNDAAGFFYYVMELADDAERGRDIEAADYVALTLGELRRRREHLPVADSVKLAGDLASALAALHRRGLVHRDIKPSNIIFVNGAPKLADIGLVAPAATAQTFVGTEGYVPPDGPGAAAADVFALGKVLYEVATGLDRQVFPKLPPDLQTRPDWRALMEFNEVILRACEPRAERRYRDAAELLADLEKLRSGRPVRRFAGWQVASVAAVVAMAGGVWAWSVWPRPAVAVASRAVTAQSVAVLPFANLSGDAAQDYFSDGLSEEILNVLTRERDLRVVGRTSSFSFKGRPVATAEIARTLGVAQLVEGTVQRAGSRVRINVRLTRAADGVTENLGSFDREVTDIFALQDEVARSVVQKLVHHSTRAAVARATKNPEAYDLFLRARALQVRSASQVTEVVKLYERAVELDPNFGLAWARLAEARFRPYGARTDTSAALLTEVRAALARALTVQPDLPLALSVRGLVRAVSEGDFEGGRRDLARAEELGGPTADTRMYRVLIGWDAGEGLARLGPLVREANEADPENGDRTHTLAGLLGFFGEFAEADRLYRRAITIGGADPSLAFINRANLRRRWRGSEAALALLERAPANQGRVIAGRAQLLVALGRSDEARALVEPLEDGRLAPMVLADVGLAERARRAAEASRASAQAEFDRGNRSPAVRHQWINAEIVLGHRESALSELAAWWTEIERHPTVYRRWGGVAGNITALYARLGERDEAIKRLQRAAADGVEWGYELRDQTAFDGLRDDPRFQQLVKQAEARAATWPNPTEP